MAQAIPTHPEPLILSIPLKLAVYGENCDTLSDLRPQGCGVCDSDAVLRVEPILSSGPDSPAHAAHGPKLSLVRAVHARRRSPFRFTRDQPPRRFSMKVSARRRPGTS